MSYVRSSTANPLGWRPWQSRLGELPRLQYVPAPRPRRRLGLGYLGTLDLGSQMVKGALYVFHFKWSGLGITPTMQAIAQTISADTNFLNPVPAQEDGGVQVSFTYNGRGSNVLDAGKEMQNVMNTWGLMGYANGLLFDSAEGGPPTQMPVVDSAGQPIRVSTQPSATTGPISSPAQANPRAPLQIPGLPGLPAINTASFLQNNWFPITVALGGILLLPRLLER